MESPQSPIKIFITGATGYLGGSILTALLHISQQKKYEISVLTRSENTIAKFKELGVGIVKGSLDDVEIITKAAEEADVVLDCAHSDHMVSAKALVKGLSSGGKTKKRILIHTSGAGVLVDSARGEYLSGRVYSDMDTKTVHELPIAQPHRELDAYFFDNCKDFDNIIVAPPIIYGLGSGPFNRYPQVVHSLVKGLLNLGYAGTVGKGKNILSCVHIADLTEFYLLLLEKALEGKASTGKDGWYYTESGEYTQKHLVTKIAEELFARKAIRIPDVIELRPEYVEKYLGPFAWVYNGSNGRTTGDRSRLLGWNPTRESIFDSIKQQVNIILEEEKLEHVQPLKIFITGATGYIGGAVLTRLVKAAKTKNWHITALVRSENSIPKLKELGVHAVIGSLDSTDLLIKEATEADVVIDTADADHLSGTKALVKGLSSGGKRRIFIHTSGTGVLADRSDGEFVGTKIFSDFDMESIHALPITQAHKDVDQYIFDNCQEYESIIVAPPTIYGVSTGPFNTHSQQIPIMIKTSLKFGHATNVGKGINVWSHVHVEDLADFYFVLLEKALLGQACIGKNGWYFCETGDHFIKDLVELIGKELHARKLIPNAEPVTVKTEEVEALYGGPYVWMAISSNSRSRSDAARDIGWKADPARESIYDSVKGEIDWVVANAKPSK
jgi:nucleoside-diphosphate-sugar epimerase